MGYKGEGCRQPTYRLHPLHLGSFARLEAGPGPDCSTIGTRPIYRYSIPTPPGTQGKDWAPWIQVEDSLPFATLGSIFDAHESINAGFAVDAWTLQTRPGTEAGTGATVQGLLSGLVADLAVRDNDGILHRVNLSILVQGRMRFVTNLG